MLDHVAHLFPAFVLKYSGKESSIIERCGYDFQALLKKCYETIDLDLTDFDIHANNYLNSEFENQILSYLFSVAYSDILKQNNKEPKFISGFSMGIYAALYHAGSISFKTGLYLIKQVFNEVQLALGDLEYCMASVIGFEQSDLLEYIKHFEQIEIVIQNGIYSFVVAGPKNEIVSLLSKLEEEGAIHLSLFDVSFPYHSKQLRKSESKIMELVNAYEFSDSKIPYLSMVNQNELKTGQELKAEVVKNVANPLNYLETINRLQSLGINNMLEVGADTSLLKSSKFIEGDFKFQAIAKGKVIPIVY